jgi:UDP-N-acetylmuramoyl-L-alanyl-D-glutamate--2,6-diaminopimelate ligase
MSALPGRSSPVPLSSLVEGFVAVTPAEERDLAALTLDSRQVEEGGLFLACAGGVSHGLDYLQPALDKGATAVVCEPGENWDLARIDAMAVQMNVPLLVVDGLRGRVSEIAGRFYGHPSRSMHLVGITGTNGKTSCAQFIAQALSTSCGVIGTLGNGFPGQLERATHTTPDPVELQRLLAQLAHAGADTVAMEVSSHALDQGRARALHFDVAVLTNLTRDHLDYHGTMEAYADSKRRLFRWPGLGCAVINMDDRFGRELLREIPEATLKAGYSLDPQAEFDLDLWVRALRIEQDLGGMRISFESSRGAGVLVTSLLGRFNASNLLAVLLVLLYRDIELSDAIDRISRLQTVAGRMERFGGTDQPLVVVDYAHTPDALEHALMALREHAEGRLTCVFGCGGDRDRGKRPQMGRIAERLADRVVVTDDNPRSEDNRTITDEILAGMESPEQARVISDRATAIATAVAGAAPGDLVLIAGKGHEDYQLVGDATLHFSDREQVQAALSRGCA